MSPNATCPGYFCGSWNADAATKLLHEQTRPGQVLGTVGYLAPEQVRGRPADARSDIFAFGAVLYEMLTHRGKIIAIPQVGGLHHRYERRLP